jgi:hypothetical protein
MNMSPASAPGTRAVVKLLGLWQMQWHLLDMSVRLHRRWLPELQQRSDEAVQEALSIAERLPGLQGKFASLDEMRAHLLQAIIETGASLVDEIDPHDAAGERHGQEVQQLLRIAVVLDRCVDVRTCRRRSNHRAYRTLLNFLSPDLQYIPLLGGPELVEQTCGHVLQRLGAVSAPSRAMR